MGVGGSLGSTRLPGGTNHNMKTKIKGKKFSLLLIAGSMSLAVGAFVPVAFAQAPGPSTASGPGIRDPATASGNNSGGTAPGPMYSAPEAALGANSPPVNSGITDPKTGANNDTIPSTATNSASGTQPGMPPGTSGSPGTSH